MRDRMRWSDDIVVRETREEDIPSIIELSRLVYGDWGAWTEDELRSHLRIFPQGQLVACDAATGQILGMAASLRIAWDDYDIRGSWEEFTDDGMFTNHDPDGMTLYGAGVLTHPDARRRGVGSALYEARRELAQRLGVRRIRAGARIPGYRRFADRMTPADYVARVSSGELVDPTVTFQLEHGFRVLAVVPEYLPEDGASRGYAAVVEWLNPET